MGAYEFDFSYDNGKWELHDASIVGGVLYMNHLNAYADRYPEIDWGSGKRDNFETKIDVRIYTVPNDPEYEDIWYGFNLKLPDEEGKARYLAFQYHYHKDYTDPEEPEYFNIMFIGLWKQPGIWQLWVEKDVDFRNINWHNWTLKKIGKKYYFNIDGTEEINLELPNYEDLILLSLFHDLEGAFDNFKYSWRRVEQSYAFIM